MLSLITGVPAIMELNLQDVKVRDEFCRWVDGFRWDYFATFTFSRPRSEEKALRAIKNFCRKNMFWRAVFFSEHFRLTPGVHLHGLIKVQYPIQAEELWNQWFARYGVNRILPYKGADACKYITKYVTKEYGSEILLWGGKKSWKNFEILLDKKGKYGIITNKTTVEGDKDSGQLLIEEVKKWELANSSAPVPNARVQRPQENTNVKS